MIKINITPTSVNIPLKIKEYYKDATETDIKVLLALLINGELCASPDAEKLIAAELGCRRDLVFSALSFWDGCGILEYTPVNTENALSGSEERIIRKSNITVHYSGDELKEKLDEEGGRRRALLVNAQNIIGKIFTSSEAQKIVSLSEYWGLADEYILSVFNYCKNKGKNSVAYAERTAVSLYENGIDSYEKLEDYFKSQEKYEDGENLIRSLAGLGSRAFTKKEKNYLHKWIEEYSMSGDFLTHAYECTVEGTKNNAFSFPYMDSIITKWHDGGFRSLDEVIASEEEYRQKHKYSPYGPVSSVSATFTPDNSSFDASEVIEALRRKEENS